MKGKEWLDSFQDYQGCTSLDWEAVEDLQNIVKKYEFYQEFIKLYPWTLCTDENPDEKGYYLVIRGYQLDDGRYSLWVPETIYFRGKKWAKEDVLAWTDLPSTESVQKELERKTKGEL